MLELQQTFEGDKRLSFIFNIFLEVGSHLHFMQYFWACFTLKNCHSRRDIACDKIELAVRITGDMKTYITIEVCQRFGENDCFYLLCRYLRHWNVTHPIIGNSCGYCCKNL